MTFIQIVGAVIALAGVAWIFKHPSAKGEGEATYAGVTVKALTQGGVLLLVGAALVYFGRDSGDDELTLNEWAASANQICDKGYEKVRALQIPADPGARFQALPQVTQIAAETNQELQGIGRPIGSEADVDRVLALSSQEIVEARLAVNSWSTGDTQSAQAALSRAQGLEAQVQQLDSELGAGVCAAGP